MTTLCHKKRLTYKAWILEKILLINYIVMFIVIIPSQASRNRYTLCHIFTNARWYFYASLQIIWQMKLTYLRKTIWIGLYNTWYNGISFLKNWQFLSIFFKRQVSGIFLHSNDNFPEGQLPTVKIWYCLKTIKCQILIFLMYLSGRYTNYSLYYGIKECPDIGYLFLQMMLFGRRIWPFGKLSFECKKM